jgi:hypothetical protein
MSTVTISKNKKNQDSKEKKGHVSLSLSLSLLLIKARTCAEKIRSRPYRHTDQTVEVHLFSPPPACAARLRKKKTRLARSWIPDLTLILIYSTPSLLPLHAPPADRRCCLLYAPLLLHATTAEPRLCCCPAASRASLMADAEPSGSWWDGEGTATDSVASMGAIGIALNPSLLSSRHYCVPPSPCIPVWLELASPFSSCTIAGHCGCHSSQGRMAKYSGWTAARNLLIILLLSDYKLDLLVIGIVGSWCNSIGGASLKRSYV